jgi:hypothetical protein
MGLGQHVKTRREKFDVQTGDREFGCLGSSWKTNNSDNVSSSDGGVKLFKISLRFVIVGVAHHLKTFTFLLQIVKDQLFALVPDVGHSAGD